MTRPTTNLDSLLDTLDTKLADLRAMIAEAREPDDKRIPCPECSGEGYTALLYGGEEVPCDMCHGDGMFDKEPAAPAKSEPAEHWSEWFEWHGGRCPLPPRTRIEVEFRNGHRPPSEGGEAMLRWTNLGFPADIIRFRYRASDRLGWLPRGDWIPPGRLWADDCPVRLEWYADLGHDGVIRTDRLEDWRAVHHVRLVARDLGL